MTTTVFFDEILGYVERHYSIQPKLKCVDEKTVEVAYKAMKFAPEMSIKVKIEEVGKEFLGLFYDCGAAMATIISGAVGFAKEKKKLPDGVEIDTDARKVALRLREIDALKKALEYVSPEDIAVKPEGLVVKIEFN